MAKRLLVAAVFAFIVCAAPAGAATVSQSVGTAYHDDGDIGGCGHYMQCGTKRTVNVVAGPGERNTIAAELTDPSAPFGNLVVRDTAGGPLDAAPGSNCAVTAASEVTCSAPPPPFLVQDGSQIADAVISLGDGDDSVKAGSLPLTVYGGPGADILTATNAPAVFYGEAGLDTLHGGPGDDYLYGGDDRDHLYGSGGDDFVDGGSGRDRLVGGKGRDAMFGRGGIDFLYARDKTRDRVSCGSGKGKDRVSADLKDKTSGCEIRLR